MAELGRLFESGCGMDERSWQVRVEKDFGPEAAKQFTVEVNVMVEELERAEKSIDPQTNTDLILNRALPKIFSHPYSSE